MDGRVNVCTQQKRNEGKDKRKELNEIYVYRKLKIIECKTKTKKGGKMKARGTEKRIDEYTNEQREGMMAEKVNKEKDE